MTEPIAHLDERFSDPGAAEQKGINLAANPEVVLTAGCDTWERGMDVVVEGTARRVADAATLERLAAAWRTKWDGCWRFEVTESGFRHSGGEALVFAVRPRKILTFGRQKLSEPSPATMLPSIAFTHTRHLPLAG